MGGKRASWAIIAVALGMMLSACGDSDSDDRGLLDRIGFNNNSPDEFGVVPQKPLELPEDLSALPAPTPGAVNRTDLTPGRDALVALGGRPGGAPTTASDVALLAAAGANTASPDIRRVLAQEDVVYRSENRGRLLERIFLRDQDDVIYRQEILDAYREVARLRSRGIRTPAAPPEDDG